MDKITIKEIPPEKIEINEVTPEPIEVKEVYVRELKTVTIEKTINQKGLNGKDGKDGIGKNGKDGKTPTKTELKALIKEVFPEDKLILKVISKMPKEELELIEIGEDRNGQWISKGEKKMYIKSVSNIGAGMSTGVYDFIALRDAPSSYAGQAGKVVKVKSDESGLEFGIGGGGGSVASIVAGTGISVDATDPANPIVSSTITQYTDELAQDAVGTILTDSSEIDFTYNDGVPSITASIVSGSIDEAKLDASVNASLDLADTAVQPAGLSNYFNKTTDDTDDITDTATNRFTDDTAITRLANTSGTNTGDQTITLTGAVTGSGTGSFVTTLASGVDATKIADGSVSNTEFQYLDGATSNIQNQLNAFANGMIYKGNWDASAGTFPGGGVAQIGWFYTVSVGGTVDSVVFNVDDRIIATANNASTTTYAGNWNKLDATDAVTSVFGRVGNVVGANGDYTASNITNVPAGNIAAVTVQAAIDELDSEKVTANGAITGATKTKVTYDTKGLVTSGADATTADIADSSNKRYVTDANLTVIGNTSGTNTGDNATNSQYSGLAASKQDTLVSGTNIKTVNSTSLLGAGDVAVATTAQGAKADTALQPADATTTPTASKIVQRDSSANSYSNNHFANFTSTVSAAGTTVLTIASSKYQRLTGSSTQTFQLPDATTLPLGAIFDFDNNSSSSLIITNAGTTTQYTVPAGGAVQSYLTSNSTANGVWDFHALTPASVTWGSGITGLVMNSVLTTSPSVGSGASSATAPSFIPQRGASTTGFGGDGTDLHATIAGTARMTVSATGITATNLSGTNTGDQTITNSSDATSHTVTLSASGGSVQLIEGSNITLTTGGTGSAGTVTIAATAGGTGDVVGPASATDNAIARFDSTTGKLIQNSGITIADGATGTLSGTNTGDQTSIVGITGSLAEFNTALTGADFATGGGTVTGTSSGTNTGDQTSVSGNAGTATALATARTIGTLTGDVTSAGSSFDGTGNNTNSTTVTKINGTSLAGLATGILKNTTGTGVPSIAVAGDFPTLNQNTTGNAATVTTNANLTGPVTSTGNATAIADNALSIAKTSGLQTALDAKLALAGGTMTGNITLGENTSIDLDPAGSADGKYSGICITGTAGATLAFGDLIYLAVADSRWELTDADATATAGTPLIGMCVLAAAADGNATKILLQGTIRADAKFPTLTISAPVYVGETAGAIQVAIPTGADNVIRVVGRALTADEIYFNPSQDHQITVA